MDFVVEGLASDESKPQNAPVRNPTFQPRFPRPRAPVPNSCVSAGKPPAAACVEPAKESPTTQSQRQDLPGPPCAQRKDVPEQPAGPTLVCLNRVKCSPKKAVSRSRGNAVDAVMTFN